jgi:hypothetical protein
MLCYTLAHHLKTPPKVLLVLVSRIDIKSLDRLRGKGTVTL